DTSRVSDPEIAAESERQALLDLSRRFSGEDLMRAFDVLTKAEYDIRGSMQPRYHLELALLRWVHLRKLVPLSDLIQGLDKGGATAPRVASTAPAPRPAPKAAPSNAATVRAAEARRAAPRPDEVLTTEARPSETAAPAPPAQPAPAGDLKDRLLAEIQKTRKFFYGTVIAQA